MSTMVDRGATRPQMDMKKSRMEMLEEHHEKTLWVYWTLILLGFWLIATPLTFNFDVGVVSPSGGRSVWLSLENRIFALRLSDFISGILLIFFGFKSLRANHPLSLWICCFVGVWLSFAPVLFWAPTAVSYYNDTFIGMIVMALTVLVPGMPNMVRYMEMGTSLPRGWTYNPSSWAQRWIMIVLGFAGFIVSRYLAAFQLGYIDTVWDPFFGEGTKLVLNSKMSHSLPISDAGLGSLAYTFEFLMGYMGSPSRWRTMPWMVTFFGILVIPLGLVHIFLVISQPVVVGFWCSFCLLAALIMLPMLPLEVDEVIAMGQFIKRKVKDGESFWKIFWKGGGEEEFEIDEERKSEAPDLYDFSKKPEEIFLASLWGMSFPWTLIAATFFGIALTALPGFFETPKSYTHGLQVAGLLTVTFSVIAMGEPFRILRFLNFLIAATVLALPFVTDGGSGALPWLTGSLAVLLIISSYPRGEIHQRFGSWDKFIR